VGRILRPHGLRVEVVVHMVSDRPERVARGAVLHTGSGDLVVADSRAHQGRWLVRFEGSARREDAETLRDRILWAEPIDDDDELWVHELIGCRVLDQDGIDRGVVEAVQENPAADLLVLQDGTLVPVVFARGAPQDGILRVEVPEGLFDL
jgi:16S rRNA processing protein RimM